MFLHQETAVTEDERARVTIERGRGLSLAGSTRARPGGKIDRSKRSLAFTPRGLPFFQSERFCSEMQVPESSISEWGGFTPRDYFSRLFCLSFFYPEIPRRTEFGN